MRLLWKIPSGARTRKGSQVHTLAVLQAGADSRIAIWDTTTWEEISTIPGSFQAVAFSPDGRWLAASHSWDIQIWDVAELMDFSVEHNGESAQ